jgi:hypothetical protein
MTQNILFLPMSIDHLGGFRTLGHHFLLGKNKHKPPDWSILHPLIPWANDCTTEPSTQVQLLTCCMLQICTGNNLAQTHDIFPHTALVALPSQWAMQFIGLNLTVLLSNHYHQHIDAIRLLASNQQQYIPHGKNISLQSHWSPLQTSHPPETFASNGKVVYSS